MRPPPKGVYCDMVVGVDYNKKNLVLIRCRNIATKSIKSFPAEAWVCDSCYESWMKKETK